ncbi:MAG: tetratricopeptide repeat protein, partial [Bacteroidales bacterium]|nr:tetratricopeptide repeat protein [Bacteroidales bacterium]
MKKTVLLFLFCGMIVSLSAQKPSLNKAYNSFYEKDFVKAKEQIDLCIADEKLSSKAQTWLYKANIYFYLANDEYSKKQENDNYALLYPATPEEAFDAFIKAESINKNVESFEMFSPAEGKSKLYSLLLLYGVDQLLKNDYENAARILQKSVTSYEMKTPPDYPLQGELYYYYAYNLEMLQRNTEAITYYQKA